MRKIERDLITSIQRRTEFKRGNTSTVRNTEPPSTDVFLHGNHIATVTDDGVVEPNFSTLACWPTVTTKSRLRALGVNVAQRNNMIFVDDAPVCRV